MTTVDETPPLDEAPAVDEATRLSTQPAAPPPAQPRQSVAVSLRRGWRLLTSMRTALLLLFLLALAAVPGSFLPQRTINPLRVDDYLVAHPTLGPLLDRLQMFDVFSSSWFAAVYLLLFVSLVGCLVPRIRLHARALVRRPPAAPRRFDRLPVSARFEVDEAPAAVLEAARRRLRRTRWRVVERDGALSAEKGYLRETGNLVFHVSLVALLVGIAMGSTGGFRGTVLVKEGDGFANTVFAFDDTTPGSRFDPEDLVPFSVQLDDFRATYADDGKALTFDADVTWSRPDQPEQRHDLRVNHPLSVDGARVYLIGHGYAPHVVVRDGNGDVAFDQTVPCLPQHPVTFISTCTIKVPDARPDQVAFEGIFTPTTVQDRASSRVTSVHPGLNVPALTVLGYRGNLGLDSGIPSSVYSLAKDRLQPVDRGVAHKLDVGDTWTMPGGGSIELVGVEEWVTLQVTQDPGKWVALGAGIAMIGGLLLSLFVRRRRVWVRATPAGEEGDRGRTVVEVGGLARTDADRFAAEFGELVRTLQEDRPRG
jgi:cytochrome c biogenesis protein